MALRSRTRLQLRRTVVVAALGALFVPAVADAKTKTPVISKVTPQIAAVGTKLTIQGKNFRRGKAKNSVLFRRDKGKALFVKSDVSTTKKLTVIVPKTLEKYMLVKSNLPIPTRFKLRVLTAKLSKAYTTSKLSLVIGPERTAGCALEDDGDGDGAKNAVDLDDDNDLLDDTLELSLGLNTCSIDTDVDGVEDGFEYQSAIDLNKANNQSLNAVIPSLAKTQYPNPLVKDADVDYDGDRLTLATEYKLWKYTYEKGNHTETRTLSPLSYSDGAQFRISAVDHVSDEERDEDSDGLTNFVETVGPGSPGWWSACYANEPSFPIVYKGTEPFDADSDDDGILDGADDQDFDDVPNIMELSRSLAGHVPVQNDNCDVSELTRDMTAPDTTWVQPFNPCLPDRNSRTCPRHRMIGEAYPPFSKEWATERFVLN